jgi:hypothetical protein
VTLTAPAGSRRRPSVPVPGRWARRHRGAVDVAVRYAALGAGAVVLGAVHLRHRPATMCPFRALTGLPCPFCGGTTAACRLGHGDLRGAVAASPLGVGLLLAWPLVGAVSPPRWWRRRWLRTLVIALVLVGSEMWQLVRFGVITV